MICLYWIKGSGFVHCSVHSKIKKFVKNDILILYYLITMLVIVKELRMVLRP